MFILDENKLRMLHNLMREKGVVNVDISMFEERQRDYDQSLLDIEKNKQKTLGKIATVKQKQAEQKEVIKKGETEKSQLITEIDKQKQKSGLGLGFCAVCGCCRASGKLSEGDRKTNGLARAGSFPAG